VGGGIKRLGPVVVAGTGNHHQVGVGLAARHQRLRRSKQALAAVGVAAHRQDEHPQPLEVRLGAPVHQPVGQVDVGGVRLVRGGSVEVVFSRRASTLAFAAY
jgi:hypothetical protein